MTDEQLSKLPKWARDAFSRQAANLRHAEARLDATLVDAEPGRPAYGDYDDNRGKGLPCRQVRFREFGITVRASAEGVRITADRTLIVRPHVSNVIEVVSDGVDAD